MFEWLNANVSYWHWIVFGVVLAGVEIFVPTFYMIWLGASAVIVGLLTWVVPLTFTVQLLIWGVLSVACLITWFKFVSPKMKDVTKSGMAKEALYGQVGTVLEFNSSTMRGRLRFPAPLLGEDEWRFICNENVNTGDKVSVTDNSGNDLIVKLNS